MRQKHLHRIVLTSTLIAIAAFLIGCTSEKEPPTDPIIIDARSALLEIKTCLAQVTVDYQYSFNRQDRGDPASDPGEDTVVISENTVAERTFLRNPVRVKSSLISVANDKENITEYYLIEHDNFIRYYLRENEMWYYYDAPLTASELQTDATVNMALVLDGAVDFVLIAEEKLDGEDTYRFRARLADSNLVTFIRELGVTSSLSQEGWPGLTPESFTLKETLLANNSLDLDIWINKATNMPVKYTGDLSPLAGKLLEHALAKTPETAGIPWKVDRFSVSVTYKDINDTPDFLLPAEAETATQVVPFNSETVDNSQQNTEP
ncbi:MAG: hypothetical protein FWG40_05245 [Peptococcaceae bacterium]|nr:hypothetical protein [Peptococcaceae bacterium]